MVSDVVYGGTVRLLRQVLGKFGVSVTYVDAADAADVTAARSTKAVWIFIVKSIVASTRPFARDSVST